MSTLLFSFDHPESICGWQPINDAVMGGLSSGRLSHEAEGHALFAGEVSLANQGGFASVRSPVFAVVASSGSAYRLTVRGDGRRYKFSVRMDERFDGVSYQAGFFAAPGVWQEVVIPQWSLQPSWRGRAIADAPPLDPARVRQLGLLIGERQAGAFRLGIRRIELA
jgi:NADH dehydrogenase [ubiquinone] 1 alpha subcomplex assembly factor 1